MKTLNIEELTMVQGGMSGKAGFALGVIWTISAIYIADTMGLLDDEDDMDGIESN